MDRRNITIPVSKDESVSAIIAMPPGNNPTKKVGVITAHGAGNDMENSLLVAFTDGMAQAGYPALRFNFPYKEKGRKAPDGQKKLQHTWAEVYRHFRETLSPDVDHVVAAGKSMGGRVASQMVAEHTLPVDGIIFLGYPLHPPGNQTKLRDSHLYQVTIPLLFFAGTRDRLCDLEKLHGVLAALSAPWELETIEGGDHSFHVPKAMGIAKTDVCNRIVTTSATWLGQTFA